MTEYQIILLGIVASAITLILKLLYTYAKAKPSRVLVNVFLFGVSLFLAIVQAGVVAPAFPTWDQNIALYVAAWLSYAAQWIALASPLIGTATLFYNFLYERVIVPGLARARGRK